MHPQILELIKTIRKSCGLEFLRLTTNGIMLKNNPEFITKLVDADYGLQGINISFHNEDFMTLEELKQVILWVKLANKNIKVRINTNIWRGNLDTNDLIYNHIQRLQFIDEIRISNIIPKDSFSVNPTNTGAELVLSNEKYESIF